MIATKDQERKALSRIRNIIAGLGEDSYLASAFKGVFEYAEANIDDDAAYSLKDDYNSLGKLYEQAVASSREATKRAEEAEKRATELENIANNKIESADHWCAKYHEIEEESRKTVALLVEESSVEKQRADALEQEVVKLKARLYDLLVGGE